MNKLVLVLLLLSVSFQGHALGIDNVTESFEIESAEPTNSTALIDNGRLTMPSGLIILSLFFLGISVYALDIDPVWFVSGVILVFFTALVFYLGLPKYLVPGAAVVLAGGVYYL